MDRVLFLAYLLILTGLTSTIMVTYPVSGSLVPELLFRDGNGSSHPVYLNQSSDSAIPVMHYGNPELPPLVRAAIDHIDFQLSNKTSCEVKVYFSPNPGFVNISISRIASDFIVSRPEWRGNCSKVSVTADLFVNWAEDTIRTHWMLKRLYPSYISIFRRNNPGSIHPVHIRYWYTGVTKPVIRYSGDKLPADVSSYAEAIEFETSHETTAQVMIYMHSDIGVAGMISSTRIAEFIMSRPEWIGDRSRVSVITEIYLHWLAENLMPLCSRDQVIDALYRYYVIGIDDNRISPVHPIHLGYYYTGLNGTPIMDPILKKI
jgi:hypothetical protein